MGDLDHYFQGSTKKILSLIKTLPDKERFNDALRNIVGANNAEAKKKRRFYRHPRRIPEKHRSETEPFVVLKKPSPTILTDSSDEYCDVTVRKQTLEEYDQLDIAEHILANIQLEKPLDKSNNNKVDKDRENSVKRAVKERKADDEKPKEPPKLYIDRKLRGVIERSVQVLQDITSSLNFGLDPPDGSEEFDRRRKRAMEFSSRFSRIHLYQLNRHVSDLENIIRPTGRCASRTNVFSLNQKFHTANQTIYQGLQSYHKHLPSAIVPGVPEKLRDFLKTAANMCDLYKEYSTKHPTGEEQEYNKIIENLEDKCKEVSDKVEDTLSMRKPGRIQESLSNISLPNSKRPLTSKRSKSSKSKRLSMYHSVPIRNDVYWKKAIATLSQKKFDVPSRYKTATFKHRPPPPPPQLEEKISFVPQKIVHPKTGQSCRCKAKNSINDIDNVSTLVQAQSEKEQEPVAKPQSQVMWNLAQGFFNKISKGEQVMTQVEYECILDHFITMVNNDNGEEGDNDGSKVGRNKNKLEQEAQELLEKKMGTTIENMDFNEFVEKLVESVNGKRMQQTSGDEPKDEDDNDVDAQPEKKVQCTEKKQTVTITGPKNAPLICIKDDTSLVEPSEDEQPQEENVKLDERKSKERELGLRAQSQNELVYQERPDGDFSKSISKLTRVHKHNLKQIEMLPKDTVIKIIEYKLQFHKETKNDCMYKKSGSMSPLHLVERISDKLLDEVLISITRDIQVEEILQKIYSHEFK